MSNVRPTGYTSTKNFDRMSTPAQQARGRALLAQNGWKRIQFAIWSMGALDVWISTAETYGINLSKAEADKRANATVQEAKIVHAAPPARPVAKPIVRQSNQSDREQRLIDELIEELGSDRTLAALLEARAALMDARARSTNI